MYIYTDHKIALDRPAPLFAFKFKMAALLIVIVGFLVVRIFRKNRQL